MLTLRKFTFSFNQLFKLRYPIFMRHTIVILNANTYVLKLSSKIDNNYYQWSSTNIRIQQFIQIYGARGDSFCAFIIRGSFYGEQNVNFQFRPNAQRNTKVSRSHTRQFSDRFPRNLFLYPCYYLFTFFFFCTHFFFTSDHTSRMNTANMIR